MSYIYDLTDTWNAAGTTFNAIKMNVTNTASAAGSRLITCQISGVEKFSVNKDGVGYFSGNVGIGTSSPQSATQITGDVNNTDGTGFDQGQLALTDTVTSSAIILGYRYQAGVAEYARIQARNSVGATNLALQAGGGNVGIGTSSPGVKLDVQGSGSVYARARSLDTTGGTIGYVGAEFAGGSALQMRAGLGYTYLVSTGASDPLLFGTNATERMRIDSSSGNVGIGTSSPPLKLSLLSGVTTNNVSTPVVMLGSDRTDYYSSINSVRGSASTYIGLAFSTSNNAAPAEAMRIDPSGNVGIGTATLNARLSLGGLVSNKVFALYDDGTNHYGMGIAGSQYRMFAATGANLCFGNYARSTDTFTETARIDSSGNLLVGTTSALGKITAYSASNGDVLAAFRCVGTGTQRGLYVSADNSTGVVSLDATGAAAGILAFKYGGTEAMRIDSSGNVGIGTSASWAKLQVSNAGAGQIEFAPAVAANVNRILSYNRTSNAYDALRLEGSEQQFYISNTERMRIDSSGNVGIGTTTNAVNPGVWLDKNGTLAVGNNAQATGWGFVYFNRSGTSIGSITQNGTTAVLYNTTSDARLKENIAPADDAAALIDAIQVRKFDWKADGSHQRYGMVAQELLEVAPEAVSVPADEDQMMGVDYSKLVPMLVKEIQSLRARVAQLEG